MKLSTWALLGIMLAATAPALAATWPTGDAGGSWETTEAGVERTDLVVGSGEEAVEGALIEVHYTGMLGNGSVFDSSVTRGQPFEFRLGAHQVIRGWEDGVAGMKVGGKRRLVIPPELGYGQRAAGPIPPGSTLYFEVELMRVVESPGPRPEGPRQLDPREFRTLRSGLSWADVQRGDGNKPKDDDLVCLSYTAWSGDTLVDHTRAKGRCWWFRYVHDDVIEGLTEGIETMRVGGIRQLIVPPDMLAGECAGEPLESTEPLLFEVELVVAER